MASPHKSFWNNAANTWQLNTPETQLPLVPVDGGRSHSPWLQPKDPAYVLITDARSAFDEAKQWIKDYPHLGGANFGRSLVFLSDSNVAMLAKHKMLDSALAHEIFHSKIGDYSIFFPKWLEEGIAELVSADHSDREERKIILSDKEIELLGCYVRAGVWQLPCSPLVDLSSRDITRTVVRKFVAWLSISIGIETLLKAARSASLAEPWEKHFDKIVNRPIDFFWNDFVTRYLSK